MSYRTHLPWLTKVQKEELRMVEIFKTVEDSLTTSNEITEGCWVSMTKPTN